MSSAIGAGCCNPCLAKGSSGGKVVSAQKDTTSECCSPCRGTRGKHHIRNDKDHHPMEPETNEQFWLNDVLAQTVSGPGLRDWNDERPETQHLYTSITEAARHKDDGYELKPIMHFCAPSSWHDWLPALEGYPAWFRIEAYSAFCHYSPMSPWLFGELQGAADNIFIILETSSTGHSDTSRRFICLEKSSDQLEILVGIKGEPASVLIEFAKHFRANGERRSVHGWSPLKEVQPRCKVGLAAGLEELNVLDLLWWINGPVAEDWKPYDPLFANSHHFAMSLQVFLNDGCPEHGKLNRDLVLHTVAENGTNLSLAPEPHRADEEIVLAAVESNGNALQYAATKLQDKEEIVHAALESDGMALRFASQRLQNDHDTVAYALRQNGRALLFASLELQADRLLVLLAVEQDPFALQFACPKLRADREIMLQAVTIHGTLLRYASEELRNDKHLVRDAIIMDGKALRLASAELQEDEELIEIARGPDEVRRRRKMFKPKCVRPDKEGQAHIEEPPEHVQQGHMKHAVKESSKAPVKMHSTADIMLERPWEQFNDKPHEKVGEKVHENIHHNAYAF